jgi:hypothetical protein
MCMQHRKVDVFRFVSFLKMCVYNNFVYSVCLVVAGGRVRLWAVNLD